MTLLSYLHYTPSKSLVFQRFCLPSRIAHKLFDGISQRNATTSTNQSISESLRRNSPAQALSIFKENLHLGFSSRNMNEGTLCLALKACRGDPKRGCQIHGFSITSGFSSFVCVSNAVMGMYRKAGRFDNALCIFENLVDPDVVSWNTTLSGFDDNQVALNFVVRMKSAGVIFDTFSYSTALSFCVGSEGFRPVVSSALLNMYAKRGSITESEKVFNEMSERNQFVWTSIISAYSSHGDFESVMNSFQEMVKENIAPHLITFLSVLTACNRKGMVDKGYEIFNSMTKDYNLEPSHEHYSCMVDMLGRAGRLKEAEKLMSEVPGGPGVLMLQSMLGSCRLHGNVKMGANMAELAMEMKPELSGSYVLMYNLYADKGQWDKAAEIRKEMKKKGVRKEGGFSWIDVSDIDGSLTMQGFSSRDKSHPKSDEIYRMVDILCRDLSGGAV